MKCSVHVFKAPKEGNTRDEYEDACFPPRRTEVEAALARFAVADGATESAFSKLWARILVRAFALGWIEPAFEDARLRRMAKLWFDRVTRRELPWNVEEKVRSGSFAAILGMITSDSPGRFTGFAVGDCCVAHVRGDRMIFSFPFEKADQFHDRPRLFSTLRNPDREGDVRRFQGFYDPGDEFYLMTDALACWFLFEIEVGHKPWAALRECSRESFPVWLEARRKEGSMKNDDVTLVRVAAPDHQP